jgi:hypothetical protein
MNQIIRFASHRFQGIAGRSNNDVARAAQSLAPRAAPQFHFICFTISISSTFTIQHSMFILSVFSVSISGLTGF